MKAKLLPFMFLLSTLIPLILFGSTGPGIDRPSPIEVQAPNSEAKTTITDVLSAASALPRGPREILEEYQAEMARITQSFSGRMAAIAQAVQNGQLSSEQGQRLSTEQYQMAQMQFDLLSAWRDMLEQDLARTPSAKPEPAASTASEIVMVALPFSSLQLNPSLAQYLELTPSKSGAIQ